MNSIWTLNELVRFKGASILPCQVCSEGRTHVVVVTDPFGVKHECYNLCDSSDCFEDLASDTVGDGQDEPAHDGQKD